MATTKSAGIERPLFTVFAYTIETARFKAENILHDQTRLLLGAIGFFPQPLKEAFAWRLVIYSLKLGIPMSPQGQLKTRNLRRNLDRRAMKLRSISYRTRFSELGRNRKQEPFRLWLIPARRESRSSL